jgi:hypothetical protein
MEIREISRARQVARMGEIRNAYRNLVRKPEGKIPLEYSRAGGRFHVHAAVNMKITGLECDAG